MKLNPLLIMYFFFLFIIFVLSSNYYGEKLIDSTNYHVINRLEWICGEWYFKTSKGKTFEIWKMENDSTLTAYSFIVSGEDTVRLETITIEQRLDNLYYMPIVNNQNTQQAVCFKLALISDSLAVFSNAEHDFPQNIEYKMINSDSLSAVISGKYNGDKKAVKFSFSRVK